MTLDLSFNFGIDVSALTPRYKLMAADGTLGSAVNPLTTGFLVDATTGGYFVPQVDVGTARGVMWTCTTTSLARLIQFYDGTVMDPGSGAFAVEVTVTDGSDPIEAATVQIRNGVTVGTGVTDASGNATLVGGALTYDVTVAKDGYTFAATTRTITGNQAGTLTSDLVMTAVAIPAAPANPSKGTVYCYVQPSDTTTRAGYIVTARLIGDIESDGPFTIGSDLVMVPKTHSATSDSNGLISMELYGNADIIPASSRWLVTQNDAGFSKEVTVVAGQTQNIGTLIL